MKLNNNKGFTLIELIMVIVIMGILAATVVPRFFDFTDQAHDANVQAVKGSLKSGINLYAANKLANKQGKSYPSVTTANLHTTLLDDYGTEWSYTVGTEDVDGNSTLDGHFTYLNGTYEDTLYYFITLDGSKYTLNETGSGL